MVRHWIGENLVDDQWEWIEKGGPNIKISQWTPWKRSGTGN